MTVYPGPRRAYAEVAGIQLHYRCAGARELPALLLLHQSPSSSAMYAPLMEQLADRFFLVAPDTPGFGGSDPLESTMGDVLEIADYARVIDEFVTALGIAPCGVFGHHTGAAIAVQLEHDYPGTCAAMALSGPTLLSQEQKRSLPQLATPLPPDPQGAHLLGMWQRLRDKDPEAPLALTQRELLSAFASGESYPASYAAVTRQDFAGQLRGIECPVLVFAGDQDPLYAAVAPTVAHLPRGRAISLPGGERTYVCERQADFIAAALAEFFSGDGS
jgi:haloalkane dehalogenase